jgi:hypothetical protein
MALMARRKPLGQKVMRRRGSLHMEQGSNPLLSGNGFLRIDTHAVDFLYACDVIELPAALGNLIFESWLC